MLKRIIVISFNLVFLVSITGLPLTIHLCNMMHMDQASACPYMHNKEKHDDFIHCSSHAENNTASVTQADCCSIIPIATNVKDKFVSFKTETTHNLNVIAVVAPVVITNSLSNKPYNNYLEDTSPPASINNHIYLDNYVFLI